MPSIRVTRATARSVPCTCRERRRLLAGSVAGALSLALPRLRASRLPLRRLRFRYILASAMYGKERLSNILDQVKRVGASAIDLWPAPHGDQWEQAQAMGWDRFGALLERHGVALGGIASYRFGPFGLARPLEAVRALKARGVVLVTTARGPKNVRGRELKQAIASFCEKMKPHIERAARAGAVVAIENHSHSLIQSPDAVRYFGDATRENPHFGLAFAPHHLPQDARLQARLIRQVGPAIKFFYAEQYGKGATQKLPKKEELLQMPGRGPLDFRPIVQALAVIAYEGYTEIFMHPVPRGIPILPTVQAITEEINRARAYLENCLVTDHAAPPPSR